MHGARAATGDQQISALGVLENLGHDIVGAGRGQLDQLYTAGFQPLERGIHIGIAVARLGVE